jgi:hypothetical protein
MQVGVQVYIFLELYGLIEGLHHSCILIHCHDNIL